MGKEDYQGGIVPYEVLYASMVDEAKSFTPWHDLAGLPTQDQALTVLTQREVPGFRDNAAYQALIIGTVKQISSDEIVCSEHNGVVTIIAKLSESGIALRTVIDLSLKPERKPINYHLCGKGRPDIKIGFMGPYVIVETKKFYRPFRLGNGIWFVQKTHSNKFSKRESEVRTNVYYSPSSLEMEPYGRTLDKPGTRRIQFHKKRYLLKDGFSNDRLYKLVSASFTESIPFLNQLAEVVWDAHERAEIVLQGAIKA